MLGGALYTYSSGKSFIRFPKSIFYAYYTGAPGHSIEGMLSRDSVQDKINSKTVMFTSDLKGNSPSHPSIKTTESRHNQEIYAESILLNDGNHWFSLVHFHLHSCLFV